MAKSTASVSRRKARKFPLTLHKTGQYRKRIRGKDYYFGTDPDEALKRYLAAKDDLEAGRTPRPYGGDGPTLRDLCNHFLTNARAKVATGELNQRSFNDYHNSCELMLSSISKTALVAQIQPADLVAHRRELAKTRNATSVGNEVGRCRVILRFAFENGLVDRPVRFGDFKRPAKGVIRRHRAEAGPRMFEAEHIRQILGVASPQLRAMVLLGINAGLGNADCGRLRQSQIDFSTRWADYPRAKTGIARRFPIWLETAEALQQAIDARPAPKNTQDDDLVFLTRRGHCWHVEESKRNPISVEFRKLAESVGVWRKGVGFYALRHTFQTVGDQLGDYLATRKIMGHATDNDISGVYREAFPDERLERVTDHVRTWLYGEA